MKKNKKYSLSNFLDIITEGFVVLIKKINKYLTSKKTNGLSLFLIRLVCCLLVLAVLRVPFLVVGKLGEVIIDVLSSTLGDALSLVWVGTVDYAFSIFSLIVVFKVITEMSKRKEYKISFKESTKVGDNLYYFFKTILKLIIVISLIPLILVTLMLFAILGMTICIVTHGMFVIGPVLIVVGLVVITVSTLSYVSDVVFFDKGGRE